MLRPLALIAMLIFAFSARAQFEARQEGTGIISGCSGSLVAFEDAKPEQKALFLTNGHCTGLNPLRGYLAPGEVVKDLPHRKTVGLFQALSGRRNRPVKMKTSKVLFATMTVRDVAVYELEYSYAQILEKFHIEPFILKRSHDLAPNSLIEVISGYHKEVFACSFSRFSDGLVHAGPYHWPDVLVLDRCTPSTTPGTSGSPSVLSGTRFVIGLHNASDKGSFRPCSTSDACERDLQGIRISRPHDAYSQNLDFLFDCRREDGVFDATVSSCLFK